MRVVVSLILLFALLAGGCSAGAGALPNVTGAHAKAIRRGVEYLVKSQNADGSWGTGRVTHGNEVMSMVPGSHDAYRVATTALCVMALREVGEINAHARGVEYLVRSGEARRDDGTLMYNVWANIYAMQALAIEMRQNPDPRLGAAARWHLDYMSRYATYLGGWNYYDFHGHTQSPSMEPASFSTAAGLVALWEARKTGLEAPGKLVEMSLRRLEECRLPSGVYLYGSGHRFLPRMPAHHEQGAVGRTQPANYALWQWGSTKAGAAESRQGLGLFYQYHDYLEMGRKRPYPHESWFQTSGYYYYFDHYYAALLAKRLNSPADAQRVASFVTPHQESDGSWWDYPMWDYHKPYGTAFAVMTLLACDETEGNAAEGIKALRH